MSKYRDLQAPSFIEQKRDGVQVGEKWFLIVPDDQATVDDSATPPVVGEPYSADYSECILTSAKVNQYQNSHIPVLVCYYTSEDTFDPNVEVAVPKPKMTMGGEILSLGKGATGATWTGGDPVDQVVQLLVPSYHFETIECYTDWATAREWTEARIGKISTDGLCLCVSAAPFSAVGFAKGEAADDPAAMMWHVRVRYVYAYRSEAWTKLYRESTNAWTAVTPALYTTVAPRYNFDPYQLVQDVG
jgi:hypothetical protein